MAYRISYQKKYASASDIKKRIIVDTTTVAPNQKPSLEKLIISASTVADALRIESLKMWPAFADDEFVSRPDYIKAGQEIGPDIVVPNRPPAHTVTFQRPIWSNHAGFYQIKQNFTLSLKISDIILPFGIHDASAFSQEGATAGLSLENIEAIRSGENADQPMSALLLAISKLYGLRDFSAESPATRERITAAYLEVGMPMDGDIPLFYEDHTFDVPLFWSPAEAFRAKMINNTPTVVVDPKLNCSLLEYEKVLDASGFPNSLVKNLIPNLYVLMLASQDLSTNEHAVRGLNDPINKILYEYITLAGQFPAMDGLLQTTWGNSGNCPITQKYYDIWTRAAKDINKMAAIPNTPSVQILNKLQRLVDKFRNIIIPPANVKLINQLRNLDKNFPMNIGIQFPTDYQKAYADIFVSNKVCSLLLRGVLNLSEEKRFYSYTRKLSNGNMNWEVDSRESLMVFDVLKWWRGSEDRPDPDPDFVRIRPGGLTRVRPDQAVLLGSNDPDDLYSGDDMENVFYRQLLKTRVKSSLRKTMKRYLRDYKDIFHKKLAHSETVFYRIEKMLNGQVIKNIYVPNVEDVDMFNYIDTEVLYGADPDISDIPVYRRPKNKYYYNIYAGQMVIGSRYGHTLLSGPQFVNNLGNPFRDLDADAGLIDNPNEADGVWNFEGNEFDDLPNSPAAPGEEADVIRDDYPAGGVADFSGDAADASRAALLSGRILFEGVAVIRPSVKIIQVPVYKHSEHLPDGTSVYDAPPPPPEVSFVPYRGVDNKILITIEAPTGEALLEHKMEGWGYSTPETISYDSNLIRFNNDDLIRTFWTFRISHKPSTLDDIINVKNFRKRMHANIPGYPNVNSMAFKDTLTPNKKYYYTFIIQDIHGNFSIPSKVYEVEMVNNAGAVYPLIDIIEFDPPKMSKPSKSVRKYIKIAPSIMQNLVNERRSGLQRAPTAKGKNITLGPEEGESAWNKHFKIRFVSKKTGRKFDTNFNMTYRTINSD